MKMVKLLEAALQNKRGFLFSESSASKDFRVFSQGSVCQRKKKGEQAKIGRKLSDHKLNRRSDAEWLHLKPLTEGEFIP